MKPKFILPFALLLAFSFIMVGCSANIEKKLNGTAEKDGVSFSISKEWTNELDKEYGGITPCSTNKITVTTFTNGESKSLESIKDAGAGILGEVSEYNLDSSFDISGGTEVRVYTMNQSNLYTVALGNNENAGAGFLIFFNRGTANNMGELNDEAMEFILNSIAFDPSQATPFISSAEKNENQPSSTQASPTVSQSNAVKKAKSYLRSSSFSRSGLIEQLEYEGFTSEQAAHGANSVGL